MRFEETSQSSGACKSDDCIGGFSRVYAAVKKLKTDNPDSILLNAGDNFQGTLWYNLFKWNATQYFLNLLEADVYVSVYLIIYCCWFSKIGPFRPWEITNLMMVWRE